MEDAQEWSYLVQCGMAWCLSILFHESGHDNRVSYHAIFWEILRVLQWHSVRTYLGKYYFLLNAKPY